MVETLSFRRRNLPHWLVAEHPYFVTLRLADTLPRRLIAELRAERDELLAAPTTDPARWTDLRRRQFMRIDALLDRSRDPRQWLTVPDVGRLVMDSLAWLEGRGWRIYAAVLMGNHAHFVLRNLSGRNGALLGDLSHFKSYTGRCANEILGLQGRFWSPEDFDHWCRNEQKVRAACSYTCLNPVRAGLVARWEAWPWTRCEMEYEPA